MNKEQRDYLVQMVETTYKSEVEKLGKIKINKPSLNNYLIAACLDETLQLADVGELKKKIRQRVISMGKDDLLIREESNGWNSRRNDDVGTVTLKAEDVFVFPKAYLDALEKYNKAEEEYNKKVNELVAQKNTVVTKIRIGSSTSLAQLIAEVDNLGDLSMMNATLTLKAKSEAAMITDGSEKKSGKRK